MKYREIEGEEALDAIADLMDPIEAIAKDKDMVKLLRAKQYPQAIKMALRSYKPEVLTILAILNKENPKTYKPNLIQIPLMLLEILNDPDITCLFSPQVQEPEETSSGPAPENTEAS